MATARKKTKTPNAGGRIALRKKSDVSCEVISENPIAEETAEKKRRGRRDDDEETVEQRGAGKPLRRQDEKGQGAHEGDNDGGADRKARGAVEDRGVLRVRLRRQR